MTEEEAKEKAEKFAEKQMKIAELCAVRFEKWARENPKATTEEAHKKLVHLVNTAMMTSTVTLMLV